MYRPFFGGCHDCHSVLGTIYFRLGHGLRMGCHSRFAGVTMRPLIFVVLLLFASVARSQAVPVTPMQNALSGVIQQKMISRGFASNDPRWAQTLAKGSSTVAGAIAGAAVVTFAGVTAPAWVTAGLAIGLGSALAYVFDIGINAVAKWLVNADGTIDVTSDESPYPPVVGGTSQFASGCANSATVTVWGSTVGAVGVGCNATLNEISAGAAYPRSWTLDGCDETSCTSSTQGYPGVSGPDTATYGVNPATTPAAGDCSSGMWRSVGPASAPAGCISAAPVESSGLTVSEAINNLSAADRATPLSPDVVAAVANSIWQNAASQPGYDGLPYVASDPITVGDVQTWRSANPSAYPTVGDAVAPQPVPSGGTSATPWQLPNSSTPVTETGSEPAPSPGTNPSSEPLQNLGSDPGIGMPTLENPPTVAQILDPIFGLMPSLKTFTVPQHQGVCPTWSLSLFGGTQSVSAHCSLLEDVRPVLAAVMLFVWGFVSLRITLSA